MKKGQQGEVTDSQGRDRHLRAAKHNWNTILLQRAAEEAASVLTQCEGYVMAQAPFPSGALCPESSRRSHLHTCLQLFLLPLSAPPSPSLSSTVFLKWRKKNSGFPLRSQETLAWGPACSHPPTRKVHRACSSSEVWGPL